MRYMTEGLRERCILRSKYHFIIIGSGWRALYYVRVAKALPEIFSLDAMYCRTQEKADLIAGQYQIHTTTSIEECVAYKPDFAVVAVKKDAICDVSMEWLDRGITVLSETWRHLIRIRSINCILITNVVKNRWLLNSTGSILILKHH